MRLRERTTRYLLRSGYKTGLERKKSKQNIKFFGVLAALLLGVGLFEASQNNLLEQPLFYANILLYITYWIVWLAIIRFLSGITWLKKTPLPFIIFLASFVLFAFFLVPQTAVVRVRAMWVLAMACFTGVEVFYQAMIYKLVTGEIDSGNIALDRHSKPILDGAATGSLINGSEASLNIRDVETANIKDFFLINRTLGVNSVQYALLFLKDRLLFVKNSQLLESKDISTIGCLAAAVALFLPIIFTTVGFDNFGTFGALVGGAFGLAICLAIVVPVYKRTAKAMLNQGRRKVNAFRDYSIGDLLTMDESNFEVLYDDIGKVRIKKSKYGIDGLRSGVITIYSDKRREYDVAPYQSYEECRNIAMTFLPDKLETNR